MSAPKGPERRSAERARSGSTGDRSERRLGASAPTAGREAAVRRAQHGILLSDYFPPGKRPRRDRVPEVPLDVRDQVIETFRGLIEGLYTHLPLKRSMYGVDPVQRLRLLQQRAERLDDLAFHHELASIVTGLRDAHTRYVGPQTLAGRAAMLPFLVEAYGPVGKATYIVSKVAEDRALINDDNFEPGVELRWWNAVPMDRAVDIHADQETGGRADSRRARALESLTLRALQYGPPPDEHWVVIGYVDLNGVERQVTIPWRVVTPRRARTAGENGTGTGYLDYGIDAAAETKRRVKKLLFAPDLWYLDQRGRAAAALPATPTRAAEASSAGSPASTDVPLDTWLPTSMQDALAAKVVPVGRTKIGYLRLWSFDVEDDVSFVAEVIRLLEFMPPRGLIIDLRANPGGLIWAAERLFQLFTPRSVIPTRFSLLATPLTRAMAAAAQNDGELAAWKQSLDDAVGTGELYSRSVPITPVEACNDIGQVYGGPVVAVVDANTYSSGDLFAAGFMDNELGPLVTVGEATGAGGANVWLPEHVADALLGTPYEQTPLPGGIGYTISVRRATRAGPADGSAIEDVGVRGNFVYPMTRRDLVGDPGNQDLLAFCGRLLATRRRSSLELQPPAGDTDRLVVRSRGLDRVDLFVDDRPRESRQITGRRTNFDVLPGWQTLEVRGYLDGTLQQRRTLQA
ncbi:MAG: S41 family peptidase [Actinomycetota bacterium]|nr:S41 family peptidase [Actinomycetota bacterium]